jgi:alpha-L-arabinofuranosidase
MDNRCIMLHASESCVEGKLSLHLEKASSRINPNIYGHFAEHLGRCIYGGLWVGEDSPIANTRGIRNDVVEALRRLRVPVLRWPGGCFADEYHWKGGVGPREQRRRLINNHWGSVVENNHFGTHEFMDLCEQIGAAPYVCGNLGSGTVEEMMQWVEYMTCRADTPMAEWRRRNGRHEPWRLPYFGVGNENWACGGNMRPEFYADNFRRYNTFVKNFSGNVVERIACGSAGDDTRWTEVLMREAGTHMNGLSMHWYAIPTNNWSLKGSATEFGEEEWFSTLVQTHRMDEIIAAHKRVMDEHDPNRRVGLVVDEWGTWYDVEPGTDPGFLYQQNTLRDALAAAINLNIFHAHCDRVTMANIAQMVNVLQAIILTEQDKILLTPTYHVFDMYKGHQGAMSIPVDVDAPEYKYGSQSLPRVHASASRDSQGCIHLSIVNLHPSEGIRLTVPVSVSDVKGTALTASTINTMNTFESPSRVQPTHYDRFESASDSLHMAMPAKSVVVLAMQ